MSEEKYLSFPICLLAMKADDSETLLNRILSYCIVEAAAPIYNEMTLEDLQQEEITEGVGGRELQAAIGCRVLNVTKAALSRNVREHNVCLQHLNTWRNRNGNDPVVRIKLALLFDCRDGAKISMREFRTLAAIYSVIGRKEHAGIGLAMIYARAHGCKTPAIMQQEAITPILTIKQARLTVQRLHELGWFARVTPDPHGRKTFYSHRLTGDQLRDRLLSRLTFSQSFKADERKRNQELLARMEEKKGHLKREGTLKGGDDSENSEQPPFFAENEGHREGTVRAPQGHREGTLNRNTLNRNTLNRNTLNEQRTREDRGASIIIEVGNIIEGTFLTTEQTNVFILANRDRLEEIRKSAQPAERTTNPDGTVEVRILP